MGSDALLVAVVDEDCSITLAVGAEEEGEEEETAVVVGSS
jgi:hypothetical protein